MNVLDIYPMYNDQFLCIEAYIPDRRETRKQPDHTAPEMLKKLSNVFSDNAIQKIKYWKQQLFDFHKNNLRTVIWGAGSKGISFLNMIDVDEQEIQFVVDINPRKTGMYITGTGQKIVPPEYLKNYQPDQVLLMNPIYQSEVEKTLQQLGINPQLIVV
jgi:FlaA1/EpsC-like NDP-sugar epimerase